MIVLKLINLRYQKKTLTKQPDEHIVENNKKGRLYVFK